MFKSDSLFARFMNTLCDVMFVGILWMICCIPIITAGASTTAAYYAMAKSVKYKTGYVHREFFQAFKMNFRQSTVVHMIYLLISAVIVFDIVFLWQNESKINNILFTVIMLLAFLVLSMVVYTYPLLSRFSKTTAGLFKMAVYTELKYLPITIGLILLEAASMVGIYLMPWAILVIPGVYLFILTYPMEYVLHKFMPIPEEGSEEAQKWYNQ